LNLNDFEQNGGIEQRNGKLKKKNCNKLRKISEFSIISELSNESENLKRQISTNREIFQILVTKRKISGTKSKKEKL